MKDGMPANQLTGRKKKIPVLVVRRDRCLAVLVQPVLRVLKARVDVRGNRDRPGQGDVQASLDRRDHAAAAENKVQPVLEAAVVMRGLKARSVQLGRKVQRVRVVLLAHADILVRREYPVRRAHVARLELRGLSVRRDPREYRVILA